MPGGQFVVNVCRSGRNSRAAFSNRTCHQPSQALWLHVICWTTRVLRWSVPWHVLQILLAQHPTSMCCPALACRNDPEIFVIMGHGGTPAIVLVRRWWCDQDWTTTSQWTQWSQQLCYTLVRLLLWVVAHTGTGRLHLGNRSFVYVNKSTRLLWICGLINSWSLPQVLRSWVRCFQIPFGI